MKRILDYFYNKKKKKEPVTPYDEYLRPITDNSYLRGYPTTTASFIGVCGTTVTDNTTYVSVMSPQQKNIENLKQEVETIPPKEIIHKFLNSYVGDKFRVQENVGRPLYNPYTFILTSSDMYQIISNKNVEVISFSMCLNNITFDINSPLLRTVRNYLPIPPYMVYSIVKQWFWEKK